jgi:hypothetical protein
MVIIYVGYSMILLFFIIIFAIIFLYVKKSYEQKETGSKTVFKYYIEGHHDSMYVPGFSSAWVLWLTIYNDRGIALHDSIKIADTYSTLIENFEEAKEFLTKEAEKDASKRGVDCFEILIDNNFNRARSSVQKDI